MSSLNAAASVEDIALSFRAAVLSRVAQRVELFLAAVYAAGNECALTARLDAFAMYNSSQHGFSEDNMFNARLMRERVALYRPLAVTGMYLTNADRTFPTYSYYNSLEDFGAAEVTGWGPPGEAVMAYASAEIEAYVQGLGEDEQAVGSVDPADFPSPIARTPIFGPDELDDTFAVLTERNDERFPPGGKWSIDPDRDVASIVSVTDLQIATLLFANYIVNVPTSASGNAVAQANGDYYSASCGIYIDLNVLSTELEKLDLGLNGVVFIYETSSGFLVARSDGSVPVDSSGLTAARDLDEPDSVIATASAEVAEEATFTFKGETWVLNSAEINDGRGAAFTVVMTMPEDDFKKDIKAGNRAALIISIAILVITLCINGVIVHQITSPLLRVSDSMDRYANLDLSIDAAAKPSPIYEVRRIQRNLALMRRGIVAFSRYVPVSLVRQLLISEEATKRGVKESTITCMFIDIVSFTTIAEKLSPDEIIEVMTDFFSCVINTIQDRQGTVDKLLGDGAMAFWNMPAPVPDHANMAIAAAMSIQRSLAELRLRYSSRGLPMIYARIGIHTGRCLVGNIGSDSRFDYTALGDAANLASRLEGLNERYGTGITISQKTYEFAKSKFVCRPLERVAVKGKSIATLVYTPLAPIDEALPEDEELAKTATLVVQKFNKGLFKEAEVLLPDARDNAFNVIAERIAEYVATPPPADFDGTMFLTRK